MLDSVSMVSLNWVFVVCFVCSFLGPGALSQTCDPNDLQVLKKFVGNLTDGSIISAWSDQSVCCQWDGVFCERGRVTKLILPKRGLTGTVSGSLGRLDKLKSLDLSFNFLHGSIPVDLSWNLQQLQVLDFSYNKLSGPIVEALGGLKSIRSVNLSSNSFNGSLIEIGGFPNLAVLNISNNSFAGPIVTKLCSSSNAVRVLDLSMNQFSGPLLMNGSDNCSASLQQFHVDFNSLSGHLPETLFWLSSLEQLSMAANNFSGQLSKSISKLSNLKTLAIFGNRFSGPLPNVFGNLTKLELLVAHSNSFSGSLPSTLELCSKLQVLDLRNNSLTGPIDIDFTGMPHLSLLDLATNHLIGTLPATLSRCLELRTLSLAKNSLSGQVPIDFAKLGSLSFLSLSNNSFENLAGALNVLQQCRNLSTLIITKNFHAEEIPSNISGFENLMVFAAGNCALRGQIPMWLLNCRKLQVLDLSWNLLSGGIPPWIGQMENLFYLDISNNSLTGEIPRSLTELKSLIFSNSSGPHLNICAAGIPLYVKHNQSASGLQYNQPSSIPPSLFLSNNRINGTIWPEIGRLKQLHVLDLSGNSITGIIPGTISDMQNLEVLDLSFNDLYGVIPTSFNKLTFLSKFSVANNHLRGPIPTGGQFLSFPSSSFEGNPGLCGLLIPACGANVTGLKPETPARPNSKIGRSSILGMTISIGVGIALLLAAVLFNMSKKDVDDPIDDVEDEMSRPHRLSEAVGSSKLVLLFQNSDNKELTIGDLLKSTNNFDQANIIGCGGFGLVYKANLPNGTKAAIKRLSEDCGQMEREFRAEVEALSRAQHKNLVPLQGYCRHGNGRLLIYSYMENGSLDYWLHERVDGRSELRWDARLKIAQGTAQGLAYLHKVCEPNIVHRDIKSSNILLDGNFEAHLADFGLSRLINPYDTHVTTDLVGTLGYIPPEYSQTLTATFKGDVYSFGVVLLELLTGRRPVDVCKAKGCRDLVSWVLQMKSEKKEEQTIDPSVWSKAREKQLLEVLEIACKCIDQDPRSRPSIEQVVSSLNAVAFDGA
ncbi:phytosulfokine receptor 2 [Macadamia integrifolia]|uniref:phytosulfokine receptor 2 n=1 Tax=Macadamia integrifolia TaxID=60698 RepID=UPI001C532541|nr:phytosulfokine receptor 2 [Macadamia integrifolia]XP_042520997.1 phytosulfokine receptor 2 [Macadamia integrifolia]